MAKISFRRLSAILFFLLLLVGAIFCLQRLNQDISTGKYFSRPEEFRYEVVFLVSYILIILFVLRYGYYLAVNRVNWETVKADPLYLLNKKYFTRGQWILNLLSFWAAIIGFIYSLAISAMKGNL